MLEESGVFDENIFMYGEEMELCYRIRKLGYSINIIPEAKIMHFAKQSSDNEFAFLNILKGTFYFVHKHNIMPIIFLKIYFIIKYILAFIIYRNPIFLKSIDL